MCLTANPKSYMLTNTLTVNQHINIEEITFPVML